MSALPLLSRQRSQFETCEFRHDAPLWVAQVAQGIAQARGSTRAAVINEVLEDWARGRLREATFVQRSTRGNTDIPDVATGDTE